jgi:copper chaperone CopZ
MTLFTVTGMTCGGCSSAVTRALENAGFKATVDLATNTATVEGTPDPAKVIQAIEDAGFDAVVATEAAS